MMEIDIEASRAYLAARFAFGLWREIEEAAPGWEVDLVELDQARAYFAERVRPEGELVYEAGNTAT